MAVINLNQDQNLSMRLQQTLAPRMLEMLKILNLPFCEMVEKAEAAVEENPLLEIERPETIFEYLEYLNSKKTIKEKVDFSEYDGLKNVSAKKTDLRTHLLDQLKYCDLGGEDLRIAEEIIDNLGNDGYLKKFDELFKRIKADPARAEAVLKVIQSFEPDGVGARDLAECLLIQLREYGIDDAETNEIIGQIISGYLEMLSEKKYKEIAEALGVLEQDVIDAAGFIKNNLSPNPAAGFFEAARTVIPSFSVDYQEEGLFLTNLEYRYGPRLSISKDYEKMIKNPKTDEKTLKYLKDHLEKAKNLMEDITKRHETGERIND